MFFIKQTLLFVRVSGIWFEFGDSGVGMALSNKGTGWFGLGGGGMLQQRNISGLLGLFGKFRG